MTDPDRRRPSSAVITRSVDMRARTTGPSLVLITPVVLKSATEPTGHSFQRIYEGTDLG